MVMSSVGLPLKRRGTPWTDHRFSEWKRGRYVPKALQRVVEDLQQYYHQPIETIANNYWSVRDHERGSNTALNDVMEIYHTTDRYIYESSYFEAFTEYQWYFETIRQACVQFRVEPVLDFGGGAGGLALTLGLAGVACDYADVPGPTSAYARWRLQRHGCVSHVLDATHPLPRARYRAIVTLDVFEHLPDLRRTLGALIEALAPGGWLISKSTFAPDDPLHLPQNMVYANFQTFNALLAECGLRYRGRLRPDPLAELWFKWGHAPSIWRIRLDPKPKFGGRFVVHQLTRAA